MFSVLTKSYRIILGVTEVHGDDHPLDEERRSKLQSKYRELVDNIDLSGGLLDHLKSCGCITKQQMDAVEKMNSSAEKNRKLLDILTRRSVAHYKKFVDCLHDTEHSSLAHILKDDTGKRKGLILKKKQFQMRLVATLYKFSMMAAGRHHGIMDLI